MNHTVGTGTDRYLIVSVAIERRDATVSAVTYAGQALTFIGRITDPAFTRVVLATFIGPQSLLPEVRAGLLRQR